jgi:hypothetical protein
MTNNQQQVRDWMKAFGQECPTKPIIPSKEIRYLRAKLILEEALETIKALGFFPYFIDNEGSSRVESVDDFSLEGSRDTTDISLVDIADGCEDLKVVTEGTLVACGLTKLDEKKGSDGQMYNIPGYSNQHDPLFNEVMSSNNSKLWRYSELAIAENAGYSIKLVGLQQEETLITKFQLGDLHGATIEPKDKDPRIYLVKDRDGKVIKSPSYSSANLSDIIDELSR